MDSESRSKVLLLDIWKIDNEYRLVTRSSENFNLFCLVSLGTGECTKSMSRERLFDYLINKKNPLNAKFEYYGSLKNILTESIDDYVGNYVDIFVSDCGE